MLRTRVLFFPVTPFNKSGHIDEELLEQHIANGLAYDPGAVFAAGGAGELHALSIDEYTIVARCAVRAARGKRSVFLGAGGSIATAQSMCRIAAEQGADGILLLPPYLVSAPQQGLVDYIMQAAATSPLPLIVYSRANARFSVDSATEIAKLRNVIGLKDGIGDVEQMQRILVSVRQADGHFMFLNGLPTAELSAQAYRGMGVPLYSSGVFAFAPEIAAAFWDALDTGSGTLIHTLLDQFYLPFAALRDEMPGFAVSLIKAGVNARGLPVGGVRAPLTDPTSAQVDRLCDLIDRGINVVKSLYVPNTDRDADDVRH